MRTYYKSYPKLRFSFIIFFLLCLAPMTILGQITNIPDPNFEQALIDLEIDTDGIINGQVLTSEVEVVTTLDVRYRNIQDLTGIEDFAVLEELDIRGNYITTLDTSENLELEVLICFVNPLNSINVIKRSTVRS